LLECHGAITGTCCGPSLAADKGYDLIFAADTRWTLEEPNPPFEYGQKIWLLSSRDVGAVFAGDVWAAEEGLERLQQAIKRERPFNNRGNLPALAQTEFIKVYAAHGRKRTKNKPGPVYYLVGTRYPSGQSDCIYFSYANDFSPFSWRESMESAGQLRVMRFGEILTPRPVPASHKGRSRLTPCSGGCSSYRP
jgi:hypothetical protein